MKQTLPFGQWPSPLTASSLFEATESISCLRPASHGVFFLLSQPAEGGALALMFLSASGTTIRVSPKGMNLRSQVHEYGGAPYTFDDNAVWYCHFSDQRIYRQAFDQRAALDHVTSVSEKPVAITPRTSSASLRYADMVVDAQRQRLICVREDHRGGGEPHNALVELPWEMQSEDGHEGHVLYGDSDFVASPVLSPDGQWLAFQTWSHPNMPWDDTELRIGRLDRQELADLRQICPDQPGALMHPSFSPQGDLYFAADWNDWWNLYRIDGSRLSAAVPLEGTDAVLPQEAEMCMPQWQFGQHQYDFVDADRLLVSINRDCRWTLALLDRPSGQLTPLHRDLGGLENVFHHQGRAIYMAAPTDSVGAIYRVDLDRSPAQPERLLRGHSSVTLAVDFISTPEHLSYPSGGEIAHALFYPPRHPQCQAPAGTLPPLLVSVHGGPTGTARASFNPMIQFWTTRGYAWLDINHRGSAGYGRRFRQRLYGQWGVVDIEDIVSAVRHLVDQGRVDPQRVAIRGGSAGGYAVMAALVASDLFRAGVSYYGIGDLELLARDTHKFESRYLDQLIGPYPERADLYRQRSPIHRIADIQASVLLLQGMQDKVVPPNQAEAIHALLSERNPNTRLVCFDNEGHGFRRPENQQAALEAEEDFYRHNLL